MKFTRTLIAAGILSALGSVATAQEISLDLDDTVKANNLQCCPNRKCASAG